MPVEAQYLLRFDDLCSTMNAERWRRYLSLFARYGIQPILAVIPDNCDPEFKVQGPDPEFWKQMRELQFAGATIGMHGYRHLCNSGGRSLLPLHRNTEFAGAPEQFQQEWIQDGLAILRGHGLTPRIWVAPRHGFDAVTLRILRDEGLDIVSDGFAIGPFRWQGVTWIPQQLWGLTPKRDGLWTICVHPQTASDLSVEQLDLFLRQYAPQFTCVERVLSEWPIEPRSFRDRMFHARMLASMFLRKLKRRLHTR